MPRWRFRAAHRHRPFSFICPGCWRCCSAWVWPPDGTPCPGSRGAFALFHSRIAYQFSYGLLMGVCLVGLTAFLYRFQPLLRASCCTCSFSALVFVVFCAIYEYKIPPSADLSQLPGGRWAHGLQPDKMMPFAGVSAAAIWQTPICHHFFPIRRPLEAAADGHGAAPIAAVVLDQVMPWYTIITLDYPVGVPIVDQSLETGW